MPLTEIIMQPFKVLKEAIDKVPFVKYALGIAGIAAAIAIIKSFGIQGYDIPLISLLIFLGLMVLLFVFSSLTKSNDKLLKFAGYVLVYTVTLTTCLSAVLLVTSLFFKFPDTFQNIISPNKSAENPKLSLKDLSLEVSMIKTDNSLQNLTQDETEKYAYIDPPVTKSGKEETIHLKFKLPEKFKNKGEFIGLQFNFGKDIQQNLSGNNLLGNDIWSSLLLGSDHRYYKSEPDYFPDKLVFEALYQTPNK